MAQMQNDDPWQPALSPKQHLLRQLCKEKQFVLANGPRRSTKTVGCLHCVAEHAWRVPGANVGVITISQTAGFDSGVWKDLTEHVIPQWIDGGFGMEWIKEPFIMGLSKKPTCYVMSKTGKKSTIQLESLKVESEVENKFKERRFSMLYVPDLSKFKHLKTFVTWRQCLRMLDPEIQGKHLFLGDTNPADEGPASWIYKKWFTLFTTEDRDLDEDDRAIKRGLARLDFTIEDNVFEAVEVLSQLKSDYRSLGIDYYKRYILGEWVTASEDAIFRDVFRESVHVLGEDETANNTDPEILLPEPECYELQMGLDPGTVNFSTQITEKYWPTTADGKRAEKPSFKVLDELVIIGEDFDLDEYIAELIAKMDFWEKMAGKPGKIRWTPWSDRSAFDMKVPFSDRYWHQEIFLASDGRIQVMASQGGRKAGSVAVRFDLLRKLFFHERIVFCRSRCPITLQAIKSANHGKHSVIDPKSIYKHPIDSLTYDLESECYDELRQALYVRQGKIQEASHIVEVPT